MLRHGAISSSVVTPNIGTVNPRPPYSTEATPLGGRLCVLVDLDIGRRYRFTSSVASDHITISTAQGAGVEEYGTQPLFFTSGSSQPVYVHLHKNSTCGMEQLNRVIQITRLHCLTEDIQCGSGDLGIVRVVVDTLDNSSPGCGNDAYSDFTNQAADIIVGVPLPIDVITNGGEAA